MARLYDSKLDMILQPGYMYSIEGSVALSLTKLKPQPSQLVQLLYVFAS